MADARIVANRFLELAREGGRTLTPMQLLKLVYIAHGWTLALLHRPLIPQRVEAWRYGPVIRDLYNATRAYGRAGVTLPIPVAFEPLRADEDDMIQQVYTLYGDLDGIALSNITHMPNTPWADTYTSDEFGTVIDNNVIAAHYRRLAEERRNGAG